MRLGARIRRNRAACLAMAGLLFLLLLFLRHPAGLLDANFWGEDGWVWYPDAYRSGATSLLWPHSGYLQTFPRLLALLSLPFPLAWAPTLFAVAALLVRLLPPLFLLSARFDAPWPNPGARFALSALYICLPNSFEEFANATNSQWHLALLAFLVVAASPPHTVIGHLADAAILLVSGLTGPFCILLLPIGLWAWLAERNARRFATLVQIALYAAVQILFVTQTAAQTRPAVALGAGFFAFARIFALQVELGALLGIHIMARIAQDAPWRNAPALPAIVTVLGLAAGLAAFVRGGRLFRMFAVFGALILAAALLSPVVGDDAPAWVSLAIPGAGQRYYLMPMLAVIAAALTLAADRSAWLRWPGIGLCAALAVGVAGDWSYPDMAKTDFVARARLFATSPSGTAMTFPIHPPGVAPMALTKH